MLRVPNVVLALAFALAHIRNRTTITASRAAVDGDRSVDIQLFLYLGVQRGFCCYVVIVFSSNARDPHGFEVSVVL